MDCAAIVDMLVDVVVDPTCRDPIWVLCNDFVEVTDETAPLTDATDAVTALVVTVAAAKLVENDDDSVAAEV